MAYQTINVDFPENQLAVLTLNRPEAANALNHQMGLELKDFFENLDSKSTRAVILTGSGRHFCAGADLKERKGMTEQQWHAQHAAFEGALYSILHCPLPVIAAVNGAAFGGGLELALACDFIYAAGTARFALSETTLGIMPGLGGVVQLCRRIGSARAKELIFTGAPFSAEEAHAWGVVNKLCTETDLLHHSMQTAQKIALAAPLAVKAVKQSMRETDGLALHEALKVELTNYNMLLRSKDRHEGINAFNEKRKPVFTGE